jgi:hypothetical protein
VDVLHRTTGSFQLLLKLRLKPGGREVGSDRHSFTVARPQLPAGYTAGYTVDAASSASVGRRNNVAIAIAAPIMTIAA